MCLPLFVLTDTSIHLKVWDVCLLPDHIKLKCKRHNDLFAYVLTKQKCCPSFAHLDNKHFESVRSCLLPHSNELKFSSTATTSNVTVSYWHTSSTKYDITTLIIVSSWHAHNTLNCSSAATTSHVATHYLHMSSSHGKQPHQMALPFNKNVHALGRSACHKHYNKTNANHP